MQNKKITYIVYNTGFIVNFNFIAFQGTSKTLRLDLRIVKEVHTLDFKLKKIKIGDKWEKDKEIKQYDASKILVLSYATSFNLRNWILLFDTEDLCRMWYQGVHYLMLDTISACHALLVERWLRKEFYNIAGYALENPW
ncbi:unnamed protein product [Onchocerca flexuosa]|uniref:PLCG1 EF-hand domain-containing protein n=1 Tax=Onchocerca flexuosa TaxID=387005 RepID=A0A3P7WE20_9BILA|nr:unnamed protein product [Onchocerca flexuosa]